MKRSRKKQAGEWRPPEGRWSVTDGEAMVAAYEASGQSMRAFAANHGLGTHRVSYWRGKVADKRRAETGGRGFVPVRVARAPASGDRSVEVALRGGRSLLIRGGWDEASIRAWVMALEATS